MYRVIPCAFLSLYCPVLRDKRNRLISLSKLKYVIIG